MKFFNILTILFVILKLTETIDWSWWWVLSPTILYLGLVLGIHLVAFFISVWVFWKNEK